MKFIIIIIIFAALAIYTSGKLNTNNNLISLYANWVIVLVLINLLISVFIYLFTHAVKNGQGNKGVRGNVGRRGPEGESDFCNFCVPLEKQDLPN